MRLAVDVVGFVNLVAYCALAVLALGVWRTRQAPAGFWAALAFGALGAVVVVGELTPDDPDRWFEHAAQRLGVALLLLFPYLLFRFTAAFARLPRRLDLALTALSAALVVWTFALPDFPEADDPRPTWFWLYLAGFLLHWSALSVSSAARLWAAGRGQPSVARKRMRVLAFAAAVLTAAIFLAAGASEPAGALSLATGLLASLAAAGFALGLMPPNVVRIAWRRPEEARLQRAIENLMTTATTEEEVAARVLEPTTAIVGARAVGLYGADGRLLGGHNLERVGQRANGAPAVDDDPEVVRLPVGDASLVVWTTPYAPFFGDDELRLLRTLGALTGLALDRARLFAQEHHARIELERANEVKTNFIALAAHELRTPLTSIHGFVQTLNRLGDRLSAEERLHMSTVLEEQTTRMGALVEQLLDLSRLDADAITIRPERFAVRERIQQIAALAAGDAVADVVVDAPPELEACVDAVAFERVVSNLVANALRYGKAPVTVSAVREDGRFCVAVEDRGTGVDPEFVPDLFERFTRSSSARRTSGTGLGLAIAHAYARAHGGDLVYRPAKPAGARFELVLPADSDPPDGDDVPPRDGSGRRYSGVT